MAMASLMTLMSLGWTRRQTLTKTRSRPMLRSLTLVWGSKMLSTRTGSKTRVALLWVTTNKCSTMLAKCNQSLAVRVILWTWRAMVMSSAKALGNSVTRDLVVQATRSSLLYSNHLMTSEQCRLLAVDRTRSCWQIKATSTLGGEALKANLDFQNLLRLPRYLNMLSFSMASLCRLLQRVLITRWQWQTEAICSVGVRLKWASLVSADTVKSEHPNKSSSLNRST